MNLSINILVQVVIIYILIAIGYVLTKMKKLNDEGIGQMTTILLYVVTPCVLINAYQQKDFSISQAKMLGMAAVFSFLVHVIGIVLCTLFYRPEPTKRYRVNIFAAVYSNCGFMAIPLLSAALGNDGVFYGSMYLAIFTPIYWIHGPFLYTGDKKQLSFKKAVLNPGVIGTIAALLLFVLNIKLPYVISESVSYMASLNTPLAMLVLGSYLTKVDFRKVFRDSSVYSVSIFRLLIIPAISVGLAKLLQLDPLVAQAVLIPAACPTATVCTLFASRYHLDATHASELVSITTVLSIITIPIMVLLY